MSDLPQVIPSSSQPPSVEGFIAAFGEMGLIGEEIADVIWLALKIQQNESPISIEDDREKLEVGKFDKQISNLQQSDSSNSQQSDSSDSADDRANIYASEDSLGNNSQFGSRDLAIRLPDARSVQEPLIFARALRPLCRRLPSANMVLDEAATVEQIAEEQLWMPVLKPDLEPWLEIALVVDESKSMLLWQRTIREVQRLLERYGIFRDVRTWGMVVDRVEDSEGIIRQQIRIRPGIGKAARHQRTHSPAELIDPLGRRLVLIATDCVESHWHDGTMLSALRTWSQSSSIAIIQMLPEWLWSKTALNLAAPVRFQSLLPGQPSQRLKAKPLDDWDEIDFKTGIQVPIVTLEPKIIKIWSQLVAGKSDVWAPGFVFEPELFEPDEESEIENDSDSNLSAEQRVEQFHKEASPIAWKLAKLLAAAPIVTLPVIRIIQKELLLKSRQFHVAEVILGGLLRPLQLLSEITPETNPDTIRYEFVQGVREALIGSSRRSDAVDVLMVISNFINRGLGRSIPEFVAYLKDPKHIRSGEFLPNPIATVTAQILKQLGGEYAVFAAELGKVATVTFDKEDDRFDSGEIEVATDSEIFTQGHACIIGVGGDLPTTISDANGLANILQDPERCAYPDEQVQLLTGDGATRSHIIAALEKLATTTNAESTVLIYFSGHGYQITKPFKSYYLMPHGYDAEDLPETAISGSEFIDLLRDIPAQKLLVMLDCCHAGGLSDISGFQIDKAPLPPEATRMFAKGGGRIMIGSSQLNELSYAGTPYSTFTYALMKGLCGIGASQEDGYVRATDLVMYASRIVPTMTGDRQHPILDIEKADNFKLAYYAGGRSQQKGLPSELDREPKIESQPGELKGQVESTVNVTASGDRSAVFGGNANGAIIIPGNNNVVGDRNFVQKGKYNVNIGNAKNLNIGDTYRFDEIDRELQASTDLSTKGIEVSSQASTIEVSIFFATDRQQLDTSSVKTFYGGKKNTTDRIEYGLAKVSHPKNHRVGEIERPSVLKLEFREDPEKHIILSDIDTFDQYLFENTLRNSISRSKVRDLLIFIHGYNMSFKNAVLKTAQITYDLQFSGQVILYSWPSAVKTGLYTSDENNIDWTIPHFVKFINSLLVSTNVGTIDIISEGMGSRILIQAINRPDNAILLKYNAAKLRNVIFIAPDIDADMFRHFAEKIKEKVDRVTLYASSNDKTLKASKLIHGGSPRAGDAGENLVIVEGVDTIDASFADTNLTSYFYFDNKKSIISDIFTLIHHNLSPNERLSLKRKTIRDLHYWLLQL